MNAADRRLRRDRWRRLAGGLAGALLLGLCAAAARAEDAFAPGRTFAGFVDLGGQQIALPAGEWLLAGHGYEMVAGLGDVAYGAIESAVLFQIEDGRVTALVVAHHNMIPIERGWGTASECMRSDLPVVVEFDAADGHGFCGFAAAVDTSSAKGSPSSWKSALLFARTRELGLPHVWLMAGLRLSDRHDVVDVRYYFSAGARHYLAAIANAPGAAAPPAAPPVAMIQLGRWLQDMRTLVALGFDNGLAGVSPIPMPWPAGSPAVPRVVEIRLGRLAALRVARAAPDEFDAARRKAIVAAAGDVVPPQASPAERAAWKSLVHQAATVAENFAVNFLVMGNVAQAFGLLPLQMTADMAQTSVHEWAWNSFGPSWLREMPAIDFAQVGTIRPVR
jgi:hypothetical protein